MEEDWDNLFDFDLTFSSDDNHVNNPMSVDDIEQLLFKDDDEGDQVPSGFLNDILLDSPLEQGEKSGEVVDDLSDSDQKNEASVEDPDLAKKRKRQVRNRDAAVRSRERKKSHVKDLEMKSRYYEGECRRLGSLLHWYMAENQALRFSLHTTTTSTSTTITKQESAVLFLESLLLGSLLRLMVPSLVLLLLLLLVQTQSQSQGVEEKHLPSLLLPLRKKVEGTKPLSLGKPFKASRSRMRNYLQLVLPVF